MSRAYGRIPSRNIGQTDWLIRDVIRSTAKPRSRLWECPVRLNQGNVPSCVGHGVAAELAAWGFEFRAEAIEKTKPTSIESAFLKGSTVINLLQIGAPPEIASRLPKGQLIRVKLEIDLDPPPRANTEVQTRLVPTPHQVRVYDLPSLFAGKLHAVLCRNWKSRVKGRDFYDLIWYVGRNTTLNLPHLESRMRH
jgi:hypothetical protein